MLRLVPTYLLGLVSLLLAAQTALAWNAGGHMTSAAFAYDVLKKNDPATLAKVVALLKQHPSYERMWAKKLDDVDPEMRDQVLFMLAARWADDVRKTEYDHPMWHYIDLPYKAPGDEDIETGDPPDPNIVVGFRTNVEILTKPDASPEDKAVALTWIMHLVGDVHQPLHTTSRFSADFPAPKGDQGATKAFIRAKPGAEPISLHKYWDDLILGSDRYQDAKNRAIEIRTSYPREKLPELGKTITPADFQKWIQESFEAAKTSVYENGKLKVSPTKNDAPALPDYYSKFTKPVAERRMADAGYRMADLLSYLMREQGNSSK